MRFAGVLAAALMLAAPLAVRAVDAPHDAGTYCSNCHMGHNAPGGALTNQGGNFNLCQSCHLGKTSFGFDWSAADQAVPGSSGRSHSWSGAADNPGMGATAPSASSADSGEAAMAKMLGTGNLLQCSTCHDPHQSDAFAGQGRGTQHVSAITRSGTGTGTMTRASGSPVAGATAKAYLVQIVQAGSGTTALFKLSNDKGASWFGCSAPTSYATYVATSDPANAPTAAGACQVGASVPLNDGSNVTVAFAGGANSFLVGDKLSFYVSYPYLRVDDTDAKMCVTCHKDRDMRHQDVEGVPGGAKTIVLGTTVFSHPVGEGLAKPYDRTVGSNGAILDADGSAQAAGNAEGNATNDLVVGSTGNVTCLTCHHPHNADSNSLTIDPR